MKFELQHIPYDRCPDCGARWVRLGVDNDYHTGEIRRHVNGGEWEYIEFTCGRRDAYVPNFLKVQAERPCLQTAEQRAIRERKIQARKKLEKTVREADLTDGEKDRLLRELGCVFPSTLR